MSVHRASGRAGSLLIRAILRVFLTLFAMLCGFALTAMLGANFLVSGNAGLAGGAEVLFYGAAGAIAVGAIAGIVLSRLGLKTLSWAALAAALLLVALLASTFWNQPGVVGETPPMPVTKSGPEDVP